LNGSFLIARLARIDPLRPFAVAAWPTAVRRE
jgi:hypothetical protein